MSQLSAVLRDAVDDRLAFWCPGCDEAHTIRHGTGPPPRWTWNGNAEHPTFKPSIKVTGTQRLTDDEYARVMRGEKIEPRPMCCHSFITDGRIQFLGDCTHALAGQTVELPPWPRRSDE